jgi:hypothetical protein
LTGVTRLKRVQRRFGEKVPNSRGRRETFRRYTALDPSNLSIAQISLVWVQAGTDSKRKQVTRREDEKLQLAQIKRTILDEVPSEFYLSNTKRHSLNLKAILSCSKDDYKNSALQIDIFDLLQ